MVNQINVMFRVLHTAEAITTFPSQTKPEILIRAPVPMKMRVPHTGEELISHPGPDMAGTRNAEGSRPEHPRAIQALRAQETASVCKNSPPPHPPT